MDEDDAFERLMKSEQKQGAALKQAEIDLELKKKADELAMDLEKNEKNYSDIDI